MLKKPHKKIVTVVGARPQFIKAAIVSHNIALFENLEEIIIHTGQHYDENMSDLFFDQMHIPKPRYNLSVSDLPHGAMTGRMLEKIEACLIEEQPDLVLVYGDTNSTLAAALAAVKLHIRVAHVEAGLRSYNKKMPEEINRVLTDQVSDFLFCPTEQAIKNLKQEGIITDNKKILLTGDVMYDSVLFFEQYIQNPAFETPDRFILSTIHREENTNHKSRLVEIINALNKIHEKIPVIMPLHPRTKRFLQEYGCEVFFTTIEPVGYLQMMALLKKCSLVITDSGGLQKEAYFFQKPCVTVRDETEWTELTDIGANIISTSNAEDIIEKSNLMLNRQINYQSKLYGDGNAAYKIASFLSDI